MKRILLLITILFSVCSISYAAFPIADDGVKVEKEVIATTPTKTKKQLKKERKITRIYNKVLKKIGAADEGSSPGSLMNILSFVSAILALIFIATGALFLASIPLAIAAVVLGIIGLRKGESARGLGVIGIALGGGLLLLLLIALLFLAAWLGGL